MELILKYNNKNKFRVVQFTDTHIGTFPFSDKDFKTITLVNKALEVLEPDLIVHTGDIVWSDGVDNVEKIFIEFLKCIDTFKIPTAITFGNHDSEEFVTRNRLRSLTDEYLTSQAKKTNLFLANDREAYTVEIFSHDGNAIENLLFIIDSGDYDPFKVGLYGWVLPEQVEWFRKTSQKYYNKFKDNKKRNIIFQHIPVPEFWQAATKKNILTGFCKETNEMISSPKINTGLYANALIDKRVWGIVAGHDHDNNFDSMLNNLHLLFGQVSGYNTYGSFKRGVRVFDFVAEPFSISSFTVTIDELNKK